MRFKRNRLGYWSLVIFTLMVVLSLFAEVLSTDKPLIVRYQGQTYFPVLRDYSEKTFGGDFETPADYLDPFIRDRITAGDNWAVFAPNTYGARTLNYFAKAPSPAAPSADNWLGTDDRGRDLLAQLIYGFRVSVLFALALTVIGTVLGVAAGAVQGYFAGRIDLAFQRFIEIWGSMPELYLLIIFSAIFKPSVTLLLDPAEPVRLDGPVGLRARRVPAQPPDGLRARRARARRKQPADHVAPHPAEQHGARRHFPAVSHERGDPGADLARLSRPRGAARHAVAGRIAEPGQVEHRRLVDLAVDLRRAGHHADAADLHGRRAARCARSAEGGQVSDMNPTYETAACST
jgi:hypothetical protein